MPSVAVAAAGVAHLIKGVADDERGQLFLAVADALRLSGQHHTAALFEQMGSPTPLHDLSNSV